MEYVNVSQACITHKTRLLGLCMIKTESNGTACFKIVNNCLNTNIYSYLETCGGQSSDLYLNAVHFFNTSFNWTFKLVTVVLLHSCPIRAVLFVCGISDEEKKFFYP
jgi:hypothetical protein